MGEGRAPDDCPGAPETDGGEEGQRRWDGRPRGSSTANQRAEGCPESLSLSAPPAATPPTAPPTTPIPKPSTPAPNDVAGIFRLKKEQRKSSISQTPFPLHPPSKTASKPASPAKQPTHVPKPTESTDSESDQPELFRLLGLLGVGWLNDWRDAFNGTFMAGRSGRVVLKRHVGKLPKNCRGREVVRGVGGVSTDKVLVSVDAVVGRSVKKHREAGERAPARLPCCIIAISSFDSPASDNCVAQDGGRFVRSSSTCRSC